MIVDAFVPRMQSCRRNGAVHRGIILPQLHDPRLRVRGQSGVNFKHMCSAL